MTFWERFYELCLENKTKPNPVAAQLGISTATVTRWKNGSYPSSKYLQKLANYLNVSTDYILGKTNIKKEQTALGELPASEEMQKLLQETSTLSDEEARKVREYVELLKLKRNQESS